MTLSACLTRDLEECSYTTSKFNPTLFSSTLLHILFSPLPIELNSALLACFPVCFQICSPDAPMHTHKLAHNNASNCSWYSTPSLVEYILQSKLARHNPSTFPVYSEVHFGHHHNDASNCTQLSTCSLHNYIHHGQLSKSAQTHL